MTKTFSEYAASRTAVAAPLGATDKMLIMQGGVLKQADPRYTAVLLDIGGSGERCQVTARYDGLDDNGDKIWSLVANPL